MPVSWYYCKHCNRYFSKVIGHNGSSTTNCLVCDHPAKHIPVADLRQQYSSICRRKGAL